MRTQRVLLLALAALPLGCAGATAPRPPDPARAREALRTALDAWQRGESTEALKQRRPPIQVVDHEWRDGVQLVRYRLGDHGQAAGGDLRCPVVLLLRGKNGKAVEKKAVFGVGTAPVLTVVREEDP
jgi:hypothetical protein